MAESPLKRQREETLDEEELIDETKRHKTYNQILSLLETEEEVPAQDVSSLMSSLEHEISLESCFDPLDLVFSSETIDLENPSIDSDFNVSDYGSSSPVSGSKEEHGEEEGDKESVIRHLLEASDDELGIPQAEIKFGEDEINGGDGFFSVCDGLWDLEDEAANYYTYLQSELFM